MRIFRRIVYIFARIFFRIDFVGAQNIPPTGPVVIASNHPSYLDPIILQMGTDRWVRWMGQKEIRSWPLVGILVKWAGMLEVASTVQGGGHALVQATKVLDDGGVVGLFPEGGRTEPGQVMGVAKAGLGRLALHPNVTIVPAVIFGSGRCWPRHFMLPRAMKIVVAYLQPLRCTGEPTRERFQEIANEVRRRIVEVQENHRIGPPLPGSKAAEATGY